MQIRAHQTLASLFVFGNFCYNNFKAQAKHDGQEFKLWECTRVDVNFYFWSLRPNRRDSSKNDQERNNCRRVSGQMTVSFNSCPPPPPTPGRRLNSGQTSKHQWDRLNCFSIAEECSALHIHSQSKEGFHIRSTNIILNIFPCFSACHNWTYLTRCKTGCNKFTDESCDDLGERDN